MPAPSSITRRGICQGRIKRFCLLPASYHAWAVMHSQCLCERTLPTQAAPLKRLIAQSHGAIDCFTLFIEIAHQTIEFLSSPFLSLEYPRH